MFQFLTRYSIRLALAAVFLGAQCTDCSGQSSASIENSISIAPVVAPLQDSPGESTERIDSAAGGGANADFQTLIDLIQDTIPGDWDTDDTITQFPSGVWIDPTGVMHRHAQGEVQRPRFTPRAETINALAATLGDLQQVTDLRWVSLSEIDQLLAERAGQNRLQRPAGLMLGGLSRIDYLHWNAEHRQWYLGGPAGNFKISPQGDLVSESNGLPPLLLEDLLTVAPQVLNRGPAFGCTIDPSADGLSRAHEFLGRDGILRTLQSNPALFAQQLSDVVGPQQLKLINLPEGCATGLALLIADEHMKRVGLELTDQKYPIISYWQSVAKQAASRSETMVRWWFSLAPQPITLLSSSQPGCLDYQLDRSSVSVQSQSQWMQANGQRFAQADRDVAADEFAKSFTDQFHFLQQQHTFYGRLRHIFDMSVVLEMIRRSAESDPTKELSRLAAWDSSTTARRPLGSIDSLVATKKLKNRSVSAVISGGVLIDVKEVRARSQTPTTGSQVTFTPDAVLPLR